MKSVGAQPISDAACEKQFRAHSGSCETRSVTLVPVVAGADAVAEGVVVWAAARPRKARESENVPNCIVVV